jgi:NUMOD4 motif-containing protein/HNH endonuclease
MEMWRPAAGFEEYYEVSDHGRVRRIKPAKGALLGRCLKPKPTYKGYLLVNLSIGAKMHKKSIARMVAKTFLPNPENKPEVNHKDGNKKNNRVRNLEWATTKENANHAVRAGLRLGPRGILHGDCKLTEIQVLEIREKAKTRKHGFVSKTAREYGVSHQLISAIIHRRIWKHI